MSTEPKECEHAYVFLRQITEERTWHNWVTDDVFFCSKCLQQRRIEAITPEKSRW